MNEDPQKVEDIPEDYDRFRVGVTVFEHDPAKERYRNMLHLIAYDIREPARLRRVAKVCEDFGIRVEYSVFECDLSQELFQELWSRLTEEIDHTEDTILAYRICGSCVLRIASMGHVIRPGKVLVYMV
jgi:CRISPR-associated protein Cas2